LRRASHERIALLAFGLHHCNTYWDLVGDCWLSALTGFPPTLVLAALKEEFALWYIERG